MVDSSFTSMAELGPLIVAASAICHYSVFKFWPNESAPARSCVASNVHAISVVVAVLVWMATFGFNPYEEERMLFGVHGTGDEYIPYLAFFSLGYFVSDLIVLLTHRDVFDWGSLFHHMLVAPSFIAGITFNVAVPYMFFFLIEELSTPFLNFKLLYRSNPRIHDLAGIGFVITFVLSRLVYGSYLFYALIVNTSGHGLSLFSSNYQSFTFIFMFTLASLTRVLNLYWITLIIKKLLKPHKKKQHSEASDKSQ